MDTDNIDDDGENLLASFANLDVFTYALLEMPEGIPQLAVYSTKMSGI
jgi:hypothetical protein